jgi:hypothetical protein
MPTTPVPADIDARIDRRLRPFLEAAILEQKPDTTEALTDLYHRIGADFTVTARADGDPHDRLLFSVGVVDDLGRFVLVTRVPGSQVGVVTSGEPPEIAAFYSPDDLLDDDLEQKLHRFPPLWSN